MVQIKCSTCKERNDCGNFNIWKESMAKLSIYLFLIIWPEEWKAVSYTWIIMSYITAYPH